MRFLMGMMMMNEELSLYEMMCPNRTPPASIIIVELSIKLVAKMCILLGILCLVKMMTQKTLSDIIIINYSSDDEVLSLLSFIVIHRHHHHHCRSHSTKKDDVFVIIIIIILLLLTLRYFQTTFKIY